MKGENEILSEWEGVEQTVVSEIEHVVSKYDYVCINFLACHIAAMCNVDVADMLSSCDKVYLSQARWLYWYAVRYMTNETYERIAQKTSMERCKFSSESIRVGCQKISMLIETDYIWANRWKLIKHIIKLKYKKDDENKKQKIVVNIPISSNIEIEILKK